MTLAQAQLYALVVILTSSAALHAEAPITPSQDTDTIVDVQNKEQTKAVLTPEQKEKRAEALLRDFVTLTKKNRHKTFAQYGTELIALLKDNPKYTEFVGALSKILDCKDHVMVSLFLYQQQNKLPESIKTILKNKDRKELMNILRNRLK